MKEIVLKIKVFGDTGLTAGVKEVEEVTGYHRELLSQMARFMYEVSGVGLAAPQIGVNEALIVLDDGTNGLYKLLNPKILKKEGEQVLEEGCLSAPGVSVKVKRAKKVIVEALDEFGKKVVIEAADFLACIFQHEIDHLNGVLILDYAPDKKKLIKKIENLKEIG